MPYIEADLIREPDNDSATWRYMDQAKFIALLQQSKIHFHRSDLFSDPYEGVVPPVVEKIRSEKYENSDEISDDFNYVQKHIEEKLKEHTFLNCWHKNDQQSAAMWNIYGQSNKSIAIKSTVDRMKQAFEADEYNRVTLGEVIYIDYRNPDMENIRTAFRADVEGWSTRFPFFVKQKSFKHEREIRAIIQKHEVIPEEEYELIDYNIIIDGEERKVPVWAATGEETGALDATVNPKMRGIDVSIDLETLIEHVYIAPEAPDWFVKSVKTSIEDSENYLDGDIVVQSDLKGVY